MLIFIRIKLFHGNTRAIRFGIFCTSNIVLNTFLNGLGIFLSQLGTKGFVQPVYCSNNTKQMQKQK